MENDEMRMRGIRRGMLTMSALIVAGAAGSIQASAISAATCPNEASRNGVLESPVSHVPYSAALPDCRAYEQVSPVDKNLSDAAGPGGSVQSSPSGQGVTFFSILPFPEVRGAGNYLTYLATRGGSQWSSEGLLPESDPGGGSGVAGLTEDLAYTIVKAKEPILAPGATPGQSNYYIRDNLTGSYQLLAPGPGEAYFADATPNDSRILFEDTAQLVSGAAPGVTNLYEWSGGQLSLAGVLPDGSAPAGGAVAGPGGPATAAEGMSPGGAESGFYTEDTISEDGSRVFFTDVGTGQIYVREDNAVTVQVSATQRGEPDPNGTRPAYWRAATPDGRYVFFTSEEKLTNDATASTGRPDLYRFDVDSEELVDVTAGAPGGGDVLGTLGISENGAYVYFGAGAVLASGAVEASGHVNLYKWHDGVTTFISELTPPVGGNLGGDAADWRDYVAGGEPSGPAEGAKTARVTPDGETLLFTHTPGASTSLEFYDGVDGGTLTTLAGSAYLSRSEQTIGSAGRDPFLTRNLSENGSRVFFETTEALVPGDENGAMNVYEWEQGGTGSCEPASATFSDRTGGCYYLISTGQSPSPSYFGDASASGDDVFFFTRQALVSQDQDDNADIYDARVDGGIAAQNPSRTPAACIGESCLGAVGAPPDFGAPATEVPLSSSGDLTPPFVEPSTTHALKSLTRAQQLLRALDVCKRAPKKRRAACESRARRRYRKSTHKSGRERVAVARRKP